MNYSTKNRWFICGDILFIELKNKDGQRVGIMKASVIHKDKLLNVTWNLTIQGYAIGRIGKCKIRSHRLITNAPDGMDVDHINHDKLDNTDDNLRICTHKENRRNPKKQYGVNFSKQLKKWRARINIDDKDISLGCFESYESALQARKEAEVQYYG